MPLYEYQCDACAHRFEVIQKFSDAPIADCPKCGGPVRKLLSSPAIQFKGSGFYLTDYGRGTGKPEGADSKAEAKAGRPDGGASEAKADAQKSGGTEGGSGPKPAAEASGAKAATAKSE